MPGYFYFLIVISQFQGSLLNIVTEKLKFLIPELPDRTNVVVSTLLPLSTKDRDTKPKDENHKLINGNSGDPADRVCFKH